MATMDDVTHNVAQRARVTQNMDWLTMHNATLAEWNRLDLKLYEFGRVRALV